MGKLVFHYVGYVDAEQLRGLVRIFLRARVSQDISDEFVARAKDLSSFKDIYNLATEYVQFTESDIEMFESENWGLDV